MVASNSLRHLMRLFRRTLIKVIPVVGVNTKLHWNCKEHQRSNIPQHYTLHLSLQSKVSDMRRLHHTTTYHSKSDCFPNNQIMHMCRHSALYRNILIQNNNLKILVGKAVSTDSEHLQANCHKIELVPKWEGVVNQAQAKERCSYHKGYLQSNFLPFDILILALH